MIFHRKTSPPGNTLIQLAGSQPTILESHRFFPFKFSEKQKNIHLTLYCHRKCIRDPSIIYYFWPNPGPRLIT